MAPLIMVDGTRKAPPGDNGCSGEGSAVDRGTGLTLAVIFPCGVWALEQRVPAFTRWSIRVFWWDLRGDVRMIRSFEYLIVESTSSGRIITPPVPKKGGLKIRRSVARDGPAAPKINCAPSSRLGMPVRFPP